MSVIIVYDRPSAEYLAGETVTGRVIVNVDQPTSIKEIRLILKGETKLDSILFLSHGTTLYSALMRKVNPPHEIFFKIKKYLLGGEHKPDTTLQPGAHEYPFQYQLPPTAPTSFKSFAAFTRYSARAELRRDKANAQTAESVIVVYEPVDLNLLMPHIAEPAAKENSKYFWTLGSRSGPLTMSIRVPSQGYVPGQTIEFEVEVDNKSTFVVYRVEVALYKFVKYYSNTRVIREPTKLAKVELEHSEVKGNESKAFKHSVTVPEKTPPSIQNNKSKHLKWKYRLRAVAVVDVGHFDLGASVPIVIGTIAVRDK